MIQCIYTNCTLSSINLIIPVCSELHRVPRFLIVFKFKFLIGMARRRYGMRLEFLYDPIVLFFQTRIREIANKPELHTNLSSQPATNRQLLYRMAQDRINICINFVRQITGIKISKISVKNSGHHLGPAVV